MEAAKAPDETLDKIRALEWDSWDDICTCIQQDCNDYLYDCCCEKATPTPAPPPPGMSSLGSAFESNWSDDFQGYWPQEHG